MTTPSDPSRPDPGVDLGKRQPEPTSSDPTAAAPFDPFRFGKPEHPVPPEYAPPGYVPDPADYPASRPSGQYPSAPYPSSPYPAPPRQPYGPPGTPYPGPPQPGTHEPYAPYGAPTPPPYHGYAQPRTGNGKAIAAMVCGLASIPLSLASLFDAVLIIPAVVLGLLALGDAKSGRTGGRGMAIAGLACAAVGALLASLVTVWYVHIANQCGGLDQNNSTEFQQCIRDHV